MFRSFDELGSAPTAVEKRINRLVAVTPVSRSRRESWRALSESNFMEKAFGAAEVKVDETYTVPDQVRQYPITLDKLPDQLPENAPIICE